LLLHSAVAVAQAEIEAELDTEAEAEIADARCADVVADETETAAAGARRADAVVDDKETNAAAEDARSLIADAGEIPLLLNTHAASSLTKQLLLHAHAALSLSDTEERLVLPTLDAAIADRDDEDQAADPETAQVAVAF
jgi:hypothetical protein